MSCQKPNGRVNIIQPNTNTLFAMKDKIAAGGVSGATDFRGAMTGNWYDTKLSNLFFSGANIQALQNGLRAGVMQKSNGQYVIGEQNTDQLKIGELIL